MPIPCARLVLLTAAEREQYRLRVRALVVLHAAREAHQRVHRPTDKKNPPPPWQPDQPPRDFRS
jgi:hypothetical protein